MVPGARSVACRARQLEMPCNMAAIMPGAELLLHPQRSRVDFRVRQMPVDRGHCMACALSSRGVPQPNKQLDVSHVPHSSILSLVGRTCAAWRVAHWC